MTPAAVMAISGGVGGTSDFLNAYFARKQSAENVDKTIKANKELAQYQYQQEMSQLNYMNEYNRPVNQKQRLVEAGLNPALMYKGAPQNVQTQMAKYQRPDVNYESVRPIEVPNPLSKIQEYFDVRVKQAQSNNLLAQKENIEMDTLLKAAQGAKASQETKVSKELNRYAAEMAQENLWIRGQERVNKAAEEQILNANVRTAQSEATLRALDVKLRAKGIYPGDPMYIRMLLQFWKSGKPLNEWLSEKNF